MYSNYNSNIKCICLIIKYIDFKPICYTINLYIVLFCMIFNDFDSIFL